MPLSMLLPILVLLYAAAVMTLLLDLHPLQLSPTKKVVYFVGILLVILLSCGMMFYLGMPLFGKFYPLFGQFPIFLIFCFVSRRGIVKVFFAILTTIFLSFPFTFLSALTNRLVQTIWLRDLILLLLSGLLLLGIKRFMKSDFDYGMEYFSEIDILKLYAIPVFNNLLNYTVGHYAAFLTKLPLFRVLIFLSTLAAYFLTMSVFRCTRELQQLQSDRILMESRIATANEQLSALSATQQQALLYRHDMRHHFALIGGYLAAGEIADAMDYLHRTQSDLDAVTPSHYCLNNTVDLILSSFSAKAEKSGVRLKLEVNFPQRLPLSETELCAILSNGLENAITAASKIPSKEKTVFVRGSLYKGNLLLYIENPYVGEVTMQNGIPQASTAGHGFGVKSIEMLTEKQHGYSAFTAENGVFLLKVVLPLNPS